MLTLELLKYAAGPTLPSLGSRIAALLPAVSEREFNWVIAGGLGPLLYHATREHRDVLPANLRERFLSAELTERVRHGAITDTAEDVIDACTACGVPVTLLKGISISSQHYPEEHLRPMSDIDVLVPAMAYSTIESALQDRGFQRGSDPPMADPHHGVPVMHRMRRVWVELHTTLYPSKSELMGNRVFSELHIAEQSIASTFHGRPVRRLSNELQLVYVASSWIRDITLKKIDPSFLPAVFDAVYLLKSSGSVLDWNAMLGWLDNRFAAASLYVLLTWLEKRELAECPVLPRLAVTQSLVGPLELRLIHATIDHCLIGGRPWNLPLPPPVPGRYNMRRQLKKRFAQ